MLGAVNTKSITDICMQIKTVKINVTKNGFKKIHRIIYQYGSNCVEGLPPICPAHVLPQSASHESICPGESVSPTTGCCPLLP